MATIGMKYDSDRDAKDTAALIRKELREIYPVSEGYKFSVKLDRYSMGQSIDVTVLACPFAVLNQDYADASEINICVNSLIFGGRFSPQANQFLEIIESLVAQYNRVDVDSRSDYYNVDFSSSVTFASETQMVDIRLANRIIALNNNGPEVIIARWSHCEKWVLIQSWSEKQKAWITQKEWLASQREDAIRDAMTWY